MVFDFDCLRKNKITEQQILIRGRKKLTFWSRVVTHSRVGFCNSDFLNGLDNATCMTDNLIFFSSIFPHYDGILLFNNAYDYR